MISSPRKNHLVKPSVRSLGRGRILGIFACLLLLAVFSIGLPVHGQVQQGPSTRPIDFTPQVPIPGFEGGSVTGTTFGEYIRAFYIFFIGVIGILATVMAMYEPLLEL